MFTAAPEIPVDSRSFADNTVTDEFVAPVDSNAPLSDHALMLSVRDGRLDALGELFERHHGPLFGFLVKFTGHRAAAEDVAQVVFERMLKYRHTYRGDGSFTAWMYHLARRGAADHFRKANAAPYATDPSDLVHHADEGPDAGQTATTGGDHAPRTTSRSKRTATASRRTDGTPSTSSHAKEEIHTPVREAVQAGAEAARETAMVVREAMQAARDGAQAARDSAAGTPIPQIPPLPPLPPMTGGKIVSGTLNGGGPEIRVTTMNGGVTRRKIIAVK